VAALVTNLTLLSALPTPSSMTLATVGGAGGSIPRQGSLGIVGIDGSAFGQSLYFDGNNDSSTALTHYSAWISLATAGNGYDLSQLNQAIIVHFAQQNTQFNNYRNSSSSMWMILFSDGGTTNYARWHFNVHDYLDGNWYDIVMSGTPDATGGTWNDQDVTGWGIAVQTNGGNTNEYGFSFLVDQLIYVDGEISCEDTGTAATVDFESYYDQVYRYSGSTFHNLSNLEVKPAWAFGCSMRIQSDDFYASNYTHIFLPNTETEGSFTVSTTDYYSLTIRPDNSAASQIFIDGVHAYSSGTYDLTIDSVNLTTGTLVVTRVAYLNTRHVTIGGNPRATIVANIPGPTGTVDISDVAGVMTITNTASPIQWTADLTSGAEIVTDSDIDITFAETDLSDITITLTAEITISVDPTSGSGTYDLGGIATSSPVKLWNKDTSNATTIVVPAGVTTKKIDLWFDYDGESGGPFVEGETLTFGNGATATLRTLVDNGASGTMYCTYISGTTPPDNNSITGGTSSATASVNAVSGASRSTLTITQTPVTYTFNSDTTSTIIRYFENDSQTVVDSTTGTTLDYDFPDSDPVDVEFLKQGYVPVNRQNITPVDGGSLDIQMDLDEAYNASHGLTITSQYDYNRATKVLTINSDQEALNVRSSLADVIRTNSAYYNTKLLMEAIPGLTRVDLIDGASITSMATWKGAGMERFDAADAINPTEKWFAIKSVGNITGASAYYRQTSSGSATAVTLTSDVINEAFQYWADADHDGTPSYDYSGYMVIKTFLAGARESRVDVVANSGLAALRSNLYTVPLANVAHSYAGTDPGISADLTLVAGGAVGGVTFAYEIIDGGTNSGSDIADQLHYNKLTIPNSTIPGGTGLTWWQMPDMVIYNATSVETERGYREGATPTLVGFYASRASADHPDFTRFQGDNGSYYTPAVVNQATITNLPTDGAQIRLQIYNITTATLIYSGDPGAATYSDTYIEGADYTAGDEIRVRFAELNADISFKSFQTTVTAGSTGWSLNAANFIQEDTVYATNAVDGSTVTKFTYSAVDDQFNLAVASNFIAAELFAFYCYTLTTAGGIEGAFGAFVAENAGNYRNVTATADIYLDNEATASQRQTDSARIYKDDGTYPVLDPTTSGYGIDVNWQNVVYVVTAGSGLDAGQQAQLAAAAEAATVNTKIGTPSVTVSADIAAKPTAAQIRTEIDSNSTQLAAIVADTSELQADWANGGRLDVILDARASQSSITAAQSDITGIKAKTDSLTFTEAGNVDANIHYVNDVAVSGTGTDGDEWGPA